MAAAKKEEKKPIMSCPSSGHINKLKQSIFAPSISMGHSNRKVNIPMQETIVLSCHRCLINTGIEKMNV